jgi:tetratricopeptide (TPR) repeat protein
MPNAPSQDPHMSRIFRATLLPLAIVATFASIPASAQTPAQPAPTTSAAQNPAQTPAQPTPAAPIDHASSYYHYGLAKIYETQAEASGRQDVATQAIEQYKLALDADPTSQVLQDGIANVYFRLGRIREAVSAAQDQLNKHPDDLNAHLLLGRVYLRTLGDGQGPQAAQILQAAIKEYETIVRLKPDDLENRLLLGQLYGLAHDTVKAEQEFKEAQKIDGDNEEVVLSIARQYSEQGALDRAAKVIADVPQNDRTGRMDFALAGIYDQLKRPKDAAAAYQAAVDQDPDNTDAKRGLAAALAASGQTDAAGKVNAEILGTDPQDPQALIREAEIQRQKGDFEQALTTLKKAEGLLTNGTDPELTYNEALVYDGLGRFDDAIKTLRTLLASSASPDGKYTGPAQSNRALFLDQLGTISRQTGNTGQAIAAYQQMAELGGDFAQRASDAEVDTYRDAHQWAKALQTAADSAKAMPSNHDVQLTYARQLADAGKYDEAVKLAEAQLTGTPDDREVFFDLADMDVRTKHWKEASVAFDKAEALSTKPEDKVLLYYFRGNAALREKLYDEADLEFRKGLTIDPDNASIQNDLGYMYAERGIKLDEAVTMLKKAVASDPRNYAFLDSLAWAYYKQGQYAMAEDYERKAAARVNADPTILDHLGEIEAKNGKLQQAIVDWQKSLQDYGTSLAPEADPADVAKVQRKLEGARVRLAHSGTTTTPNN